MLKINFQLNYPVSARFSVFLFLRSQEAGVGAVEGEKIAPSYNILTNNHERVSNINYVEFEFDHCIAVLPSLRAVNMNVSFAIRGA